MNVIDYVVRVPSGLSSLTVIKNNNQKLSIDAEPDNMKFCKPKRIFLWASEQYYFFNKHRPQIRATFE